MKRQKLLYMGLGGLATLAIAGAALFFTQTTQAAGSDLAVIAAVTAGDDLFHPGRPGGPDGFGERRGGRLAVESYLLDELGITQEEFDAAVDEVRATMIDRAVAEGLLTEEHGEALKNGERIGRHMLAKGEELFGDREVLMAEALGISLEEWDAAKENARAAALEQALADGLISQEQADMLEAMEALRGYVDREEIMAGVLGVTVAELQAAQEEGTVRDLIEASGLTPAELRESLDEARASLLEEAVADGIITAEQAELLEEAPRFAPRGRGGHGPRGGFAPGGEGFNGDGASGIFPAEESFAG